MTSYSQGFIALGNPKLEQIISEFFLKALHIVLDARTPEKLCGGCGNEYQCASSSSNLKFKSRDKWFNIALRELPELDEFAEQWRHCDPNQLVVDVILSMRHSNIEEHSSPSFSWRGDEQCLNGGGGKIIERWMMQYESGKNASDCGNVGPQNQSGENLGSCKKLYKRAILSLRSLYVTVRLLPAYKVFRDLGSWGHSSCFVLNHRVSLSDLPFPLHEGSEMIKYQFVPIEAACGRLCLSVSYLPKLQDVSYSLELSSTQIITDYIGSFLADPIKRIHSLPSAVRTPMWASSARLQRWSSDLGALPSTITHISSDDIFGQYMHSRNDNSASLHLDKPSSQDIKLSDSKATTSLHHSPSSFSSPSLQADSHLMRIPISDDNRKFFNNSVARYPSSGLTFEKSMLAVNSESSGSFDDTSSKMISTTVPGLLSSEFQVTTTISHGVLSSVRNVDHSSATNLPCFMHLGSCQSREFSLSNNCLESDSFCPFAVADDHTGFISRTEPSAERGPMTLPKKSRHIPVGNLITILKSANPLHQDFSHGTNTLKEVGYENKSVSFFKLRTMAQALQELGNYKKIKDLLIAQGTPYPFISTDEHSTKEQAGDFLTYK